MDNYSEFEKKIGIEFENKGLLKQAFVHRSYLNENKNLNLKHNERLEFLGDAVLELVTTDFLYKKYPNVPEGVLTSYRAALVRTESISEAARRLGMNDFLLLSKGEKKDTGNARAHILANTFESLSGAIYLDKGYNIAEKFIADNLFYTIDDIVKEESWRDAKSKIQELAQEHVNFTPHYEVVKEVGPDHNRHFTIAIFFGDEKITTGKGNSKQEAEQDAAKNAIKIREW